MLADAGLTIGTPVLSLIEYSTLQRGDVGYVAGPCSDPHAEHAP